MKPRTENKSASGILAFTRIASIHLLITILYSNFVSAAFSLDSVLRPFSGLNIGVFYLKYFAFIDAIVYFILFLSLAQMVFTKVYSNNAKEAKMIATAIGLALTVSMAVLEFRTGFNLGQLAPIALIIFLVVIAILLFNLFQSLFTGSNGKMISAALTYIIIYGLLNTTFNALSSWLEENIPLLSAVLALAALVAFIYLIIELFKALGLGGKKDDSASNNTRETNPNQTTNSTNQNANQPNTATPQAQPTTPPTPTTPVTPPTTPRPRPPGPRPRPTPRREHPRDPPTNVIPPQGIRPGPEPDIPFEPVHPVIPDDQEIFIDLSEQFNPIRSQGNLGACAAFASTSVFEYELQSQEPLSPLYKYYKIRELMGTINEDSGSTFGAMTAVLLNNGVCFEKPWPYNIQQFKEKPPAIADNDAVQKKAANTTRVNSSDPNQWVYALSNKHPLIIGINCPNDFHGYSNSYYYNPNPKSGGGHAMVIVGYHSHYPVIDGSGNTIGVKAFKIRNSWGTNWAENGYIWVSQDTLTKIMMNNPVIIKGHKSGNIQNMHFKITGRTIFDLEDKRIKPERTGNQLFNDDNWPNPIPDSDDPYYIGAIAQIKGALHGLGEIKVTDPKGRFSFEFSANPMEFEPLTELNSKFRQLKNINFKDLPAGIIVYKRHKDSPDKTWYFHIVDFNYSFGGRGGEGIKNNNNPISSSNDPKINHSGIPITFNQNHTHEMYVIIPVADKLPK